MTDHNDDTILDEELDENDFNFDNENEDALLAETDYDFLEKSKIQEDHTEQLEPEEDVLDIGIADEDIVESETICLQEIITVEKETSEHVQTELRNDGKPAETQTNKCVSNDNNLKIYEDDEEIDHDEQDVSSSVNHQIKSKTIFSENKCDEKIVEKLNKPKVISLKKSVRKSYDDVPDLAKVIELVQPGVSTSRNRKINRDFHNNVRKKQHSSLQKHKNDYDYEYDDKKRSEYRRHNRECVSDYQVKENLHRLDEDNGNSLIPVDYTSNENYHEPNRESNVFITPFQMQSEPPHFNSQYQNVPSVGSHHEMSVEQPIVASVQITQERYQITGDFQMIQSSQNSFVPSANEINFNRPLPEFIQRPLMPPPQQIPFRFEPRLNPRPVTPQNMFSRPMLHMGHRPQHPPRLPPSLPLSQNHIHSMIMHPSLNNPSQTMLLPPQQMHPNNGTSHSQPQHLNQSSPQLRPPVMQQIHHPEQLRPPSHQDYHHAPMIRMPFHGESNSTVMIRHSQHVIQIPSTQNVRPLENSTRMPATFRPNVPPPRAPHTQFIVRGPQEQIPVTNKYYEEPRHYNPSRTAPVSFPSHINQPPQYLHANPTIQPPPPGCPQNQQMRPVFPPGDIGLQRPTIEVNYSQYNQQEYYVNQHKPVENYIMNDNNSNQLKRNNSSLISESPLKQSRYDYTNVKKGTIMRNLYEVRTDNISTEIQESCVQDEDKDMQLYRKKVESQKKLREKFVQMKEEQRLKNQMQSFIQNNIKGILQKREQFLRKTEAEQVEKDRSALRKTENTYFSDNDTNQSSSYTYDSNDRSRSRTISRKRYDEPERSEEKLNIHDTEDNINQLKVHRNENISENTEVGTDLKKHELHKVLKIKYKDGTVALKSIPVHRTDSIITVPHIATSGKTEKSDCLNVIINEKELSGSANVNQRRMVVSKHIPLPNVKSELWNENVIVESIRKGITQSSVPLAQRFSNLRAANIDDKSETVNGTKAKNRLVIPEDDKSRTLWTKKNKTSDMTTPIIQKMANI